MSDQLPNNDDQLDVVPHRVGSSGDNNDIPPPPPPPQPNTNTSTVALLGSDRTPTLATPSSIEPPLTVTSRTGSAIVHSVADPSSSVVADQQRSTTSSSVTNTVSLSLVNFRPQQQQQQQQPISDPNTTRSPPPSSTSTTSSSTTVFASVLSNTPLIDTPSLPEFVNSTTSPQSQSLTANQSSHSLCSNPSDPIQPVESVTHIASSSQLLHPSDPEINEEDLVDPQLLTAILDLGFEESIAILALSKTKTNGCKGIEAAVNWILEHSNESDYEPEEDECHQDAMGGAQSSLPLCQPHKMVFVANMSLKMGAGKLAAQVGHATLAVYRLALKSDEGQRALDAWRLRGEMKVVVKGENTEQLLEMFKQAKDIGLFAYVVSDAGRTQIPAGSRTVLGIFGPSEIVDTVTGQLKLL